jgi:hypothetical protein
LATAQDLKQYATEHPDYLGRQGQFQQAVNRYLDSWRSSNGETSIESIGGQQSGSLNFC